MDVVIRGIHQALAGTTLRLVSDRQADREILMGSAGRPHMIRTTHTGPGERIATVTGDNVGSGVRMPGVAERFISLNEYTGLKASRCSGGPATADMVVEYLLDLTTQKWTVAAREWSQRDIVMVRPLEMLRVPASATSGETRVVGNRTARAIGAPLASSPAQGVFLTGDPAPNPAEFAPVQSLWIDTVSLRPLRWEVSQRQAIVNRVDFIYESLVLRRPDGVSAPRCIP